MSAGGVVPIWAAAAFMRAIRLRITIILTPPQYTSIVSLLFFC